MEGTAQASGTASRIHSVIAELVGKPLFWILIVGTLASYPMALAFLNAAPEPPKVLSQLPDFSVIDQNGEAFGLQRMAGKVWIANFIFTRCPTICVQLTEEMERIQIRLKHANRQIQLVSFSVDPDYDTPERLKTYGARFRAQPWLWTFVTGPIDSLKKVIIDGFKISMGREEGTPPDDILSIFHGTKLVLVDRQGGIRGYYDADRAGVDRLLVEAGIVANVTGSANQPKQPTGP